MLIAGWSCLIAAAVYRGLFKFINPSGDRRVVAIPIALAVLGLVLLAFNLVI